MTTSVKNFFIIFLICASTVSYSQTEKGFFIFGGTLGMSVEKIKYEEAANMYSFNDEKTHSLNVNPGISYFVINNLSAGILFPINYSRTTYSDSEEMFKETIFSVGPVVRYYYPLGQWAIFSQLNVNFGKYNIDAIQLNPYRGEFFETSIKGAVTAYSGGLGTTFFITNSLGIEAILFYKYELTNFEEYVIKEREHKSLNFNVGMQIYLPK